MAQGDLPTLRLVTLRCLVAKAAPVLIFDLATELAAVEARLRASPGSVAVVVDGNGVLRGTIRLGDLGLAARQAQLDAVMATDMPVLAGESELRDAQVAMSSQQSDRIVVAGADGELLGVLTDWDIAHAMGHRAA